MNGSPSMAGRAASGLRIATLCGSIKPFFSGTEDYHDRLVTALAAAGADPVAVDIGDWGLRRIGTLLQAVSAARPDVVLLQYPTDAFRRSLLPQLFAGIERVAPLAVTIHEFTAAHPLRRIALAPLLLRARAVIMTAQREVDGLLGYCPWLRGRTHVIPVGNTFPPRAWAPTQPPSVVYFGQIRPEKGLEHFLDCRDALAADFPAARFIVIGSRVPQFAAYYDAIAAAAASRRIDLLSGLSEDAVSDALAAATCALMPFPEGASFRRTSLLAAASCGAPLVTLAGIDTPAELTALIEPATAPGELAGRVARMLTDADERRRRHEASRQLAARVSWDSIAARHIEVLSTVAARTRERGRA